MELRLFRSPSAFDCTIGRLFVNDRWECWTLEDVVREGPKVLHETAIPAGRYRVVIDRSERFQRMLPHVLEVPGFTSIRIHPGNTDKDTSGCILVGQGRGLRSVAGSRLALEALQPQIAGALAKGDGVWLNVVSASG
jgi:Steigviridae/Suoliviridae L,D-carboxypeptidase/transpeptidase